jgi:integrase/recombinase XerD
MIDRVEGQGILSVHIGPFLEYLRGNGYSECTLRKKRPVLVAFSEWCEERKSPGALSGLAESHLEAFMEVRSQSRCSGRVKLDRATLRGFYVYLRQSAGVPGPADAPISDIEACIAAFVDHLVRVRGLAQNSVLVYSSGVREFLTYQAEKVGSFEVFLPRTATDFLVERGIKKPPHNVRLAACAVRTFFRYLFLRGVTDTDLSSSIPPVCRWGRRHVPSFLTPDQIESVLAATDRSTESGCRDYAVLILLARLGLRAGEVVLLELDDLLWRTREIVVRGKGRTLSRLPLLADVGEAIACYLQRGRGQVTSRRVFVRLWAPRKGLTGPAAVAHIVRRALARVGIVPPSQCASHVFRHSLATTMIRHGASLTEISEVLRHRSLTSTAAYSQVPFEALRGIARPWPAGVPGGSK